MLLTENDIEITSDLEKIIAFSDHFQSIFLDHSLCSFHVSNIMGQPPSAEIVLSAKEVLVNSNGLNIRKATALCVIFLTCSYRLRSFLQSGKMRTLYQFSRKGSEHSSTINYRGISQLPICLRFWEGASRDGWFHWHRIVSTIFNTVFRNRLSSTTQLLPSFRQ